MRGMFDQERAEQITTRIACEPVSLVAVLRDMRDTGPSNAEFYRWLRDNPAFREDYARAREAQGHVDADAIADVRQRMLDGELTPEQARVAIDSLKWSAGKRQPKVYGDRVQQDIDLTVRVSIADPTRQLRNAATTQPALAGEARAVPALEHSGSVAALAVGAHTLAQSKEDPLP